MMLSRISLHAGLGVLTLHNTAGGESSAGGNECQGHGSDTEFASAHSSQVNTVTEPKHIPQYPDL